MMPYMSGREFLKQIRAYHRELATKIVFMTGGAFNDPTQNWLHSLPNPPLEKPFEIRALHSAIARVADAQVPSGTRLSRRVHRAV